MTVSTGYFEKELLETFYLIVEEYRSGAIEESVFFEKIFTIAERYGRHSGREAPNRSQMNLFPSDESRGK